MPNKYCLPQRYDYSGIRISRTLLSLAPGLILPKVIVYDKAAALSIHFQDEDFFCEVIYKRKDFLKNKYMKNI
uniref:Uncharacterized protein n=1 Tax=Lepeophtheirus salmonis TaxID=72036 RepID=A0A0K2VBQ3_LEPSM